MYHFPKIIFVPTPAPMLNTTILPARQEGPNWLLIWIVIILLLLLLAILLYLCFGKKKYWIEAGPGYLRQMKRTSSAFVNSASVRRFTGRPTPGADTVVMVSTNRAVNSPRILTLQEYRNRSPGASPAVTATGAVSNMILEQAGARYQVQQEGGVRQEVASPPQQMSRERITAELL